MRDREEKDNHLGEEGWEGTEREERNLSSTGRKKGAEPYMGGREWIEPTREGRKGAHCALEERRKRERKRMCTCIGGRWVYLV